MISACGEVNLRAGDRWRESWPWVSSESRSAGRASISSHSHRAVELFMMLGLAGGRAVCHMRFRTVLLLLCSLSVACGALDSLPRQLLASVKRKARSSKLTKPDACVGKSIYILDFNEFAAENDAPACNLIKVRLLDATPHAQHLHVFVSMLSSSACFPALASHQCFHWQDVKIDPSNGIPYLPDAPGLKYLEKGAPISMAAHGVPWYLQEAISSSPYVVEDIDEADIVYVYDFCYYARWLGQVRVQLRNPLQCEYPTLPAGPCKLVCGRSKDHLSVGHLAPCMETWCDSASALANDNSSTQLDCSQSS